MFIPLHCKSDWSLGYGGSSVERLVAEAAGYGYPALALTDIENLYGHIRFLRACSAAGIRAITGIELRPGFHGRRSVGLRAERLVLLAAGPAGYRSLCRIVSRRRGAAPPDPGTGGLGGDPLPLAVEHGAGLFALSDSPRPLERLAAAGFARDRLGLLVVRPAGARDEPARIAAAHRLGLQVVADLDVVFAGPEEYPVHRLQTAIRLGLPLSSPAACAAMESAERCLRPPAAAESLFCDLPEAVEAAASIAEACRVGLADLTFASESAAEGRAEAERLRDAVLDRPVHRPHPWTPAHAQRLAAELDVIDRLGLARIMNTAGDILGFCRTKAIPVMARGSAVGSMVLHLLGASPIDPLAHGLLFERFLHEAKSALPDIDLDLPSSRRDAVIAWVGRRFGRERVATAAAHQTFQRRSALRESLKAAGVPPARIEALARALPPDELSSELDFLDLTAPGAELSQGTAGLVPDHALRLAASMIGRPRHIAAHPGGLVIGAEPLADRMPLERAPKGSVITQYDVAALSQLNVFKIDLLGNRCLSEVVEVLSADGPERARIESIPIEDAATLARIDRAETLGCFQLESPAMRALLARLPIRSERDLTAALALIRPGAAAERAKTAFVRRARGEAPDEDVDPAVSDRTCETHGLLLYEEDIMLLLSRVGGMSLAAADELRAAIVQSGGDPAELAPLEQAFLARAPGARGQNAWAAALRLAAYSFSKAHAVSYARLGYISAFLKTHRTVEFACSLINHHQGLYPLRTVAAEMMRCGTVILPPHVNRSRADAFIEPDGPHAGAVRVGLDRIKGVSRRTAASILARRAGGGPFHALEEFRAEVGPSDRELNALLLCGACDGLDPLRRDEYPFVHEQVLERVRQGRPFGDLAGKAAPSGADRARVDLYRRLVRVRNELNLLGMHLSDHPCALLRPEADRIGGVPIAAADLLRDGAPLRLACIVAAMRRVPTRAGIMQFVTLEDETGVLEGAVRPQVYRSMGERITTPGPYAVDGRLRRDEGAAHVDVERVSPFHERGRGDGVSIPKIG